MSAAKDASKPRSDARGKAEGLLAAAFDNLTDNGRLTLTGDSMKEWTDYAAAMLDGEFGWYVGDLEATAQHAIAERDNAIALMERRGVVIDKWPPKDIPEDGWTPENFAALDPEVRWQGIVFTLYVGLVTVAGDAERALEPLP